LLRLMCRKVHRNSRWKAHECYKGEIKIENCVAIG
jgi:hypothetical protein